MRSSLLLFVILAASACATTPRAASTADNKRDVIYDDKLGTLRTDATPVGAVTISATPERSWDAMLAAYNLIGIDVKYLNRAGGELGNREAILSRRIATGEVSRYLDCGTDPFVGQQANAYPVRASIVTRMWPEGTGMKIETKLSGTMAKPGTGGAVQCTSTGSLEGLIAVSVAKLAVQPAT